MSDEPLRGERAVLLDYLGHFRDVFEARCEGLDAEQLATRSVPPSSMSLLGLLRHLAFVEEHWWRRVMDGQDLPRMWGKEDEPDADFDGAVADPAVVEEAWAAWRAGISFADAWVEAADSMDVLGEIHGEPIELREVLVHLIEEYARHCGHADLLRERIDGASATDALHP